MSERTDDDARPTVDAAEPAARLGTVARWLSHWSFWPVYSLAIVLLLTWMRPWEKWFGVTKSGRADQGVCVHKTLPSERMAAYSVGTIVLTGDAGSDSSPDWLPCDGRRLERSDYKDLFVRVGERFGADDTGFHLPDYRGLTWIHHEACYGVSITQNLRIVAAEASEKPEGLRDEAFRDEELHLWIKVR